MKTRDGKTVTDGQKTTLTLQHGTHEREVKGTVRSFEQDGETRWEIVTDDDQWPAVGFLPENVLTRTGK